MIKLCTLSAAKWILSSCYEFKTEQNGTEQPLQRNI